MSDIQLAEAAEVDLAQRADMLTRLIWGAPRLLDALRWWAGFGFRRDPAESDRRHVVDEHDALLLNVPVGYPVTRRSGYLTAQLGPDGFRAAHVVALVNETAANLDLERRAQLAGGRVPLGQILGDARRHTHFVARSLDGCAPDAVVLRSRATLACAGRPAVLLRETVHRRLLTHRVPGDLPHYAKTTAWMPPWSPH